MEKKIQIPEGANATVDGMTVSLKGKKGEISKNFSDPRYDASIAISMEGSFIAVRTASDRKKMLAILGTFAAHIRNMVLGVTEGYTYIVKINSTHFPMTIETEGDKITIKNFLGERGTRSSKIIGKAKVSVKKDTVVIQGVDKESVSQTAANIEMATRLTKKDRRIFGDGCFIECSFAGDKHE